MKISLSKIKIKALIFFFVTGVIFITYYYSNQIKVHPWETESVLQIMEKNFHYDLTFMGSSHGRLFTRNKNHAILEGKFQKKIATLAGGSSCVIPEQVYLDTFYRKGNSTDHILYFIDPWCLYSDKYNIGYSFENEPADKVLLESMKQHNIANDIVDGYIKRAFNDKHIPPINKDVGYRTERLSNIDTAVIQTRLLDLYEGNINKEINHSYVSSMEKIIQAANRNKTSITFIIPATLYLDPHHENLKSVLEEFQKKYKMAFLDMSQSISEPQYYYDHDHLNKKGVEIFTDKIIEML